MKTFVMTNTICCETVVSVPRKETDNPVLGYCKIAFDKPYPVTHTLKENLVIQEENVHIHLVF